MRVERAAPSYHTQLKEQWEEEAAEEAVDPEEAAAEAAPPPASDKPLRMTRPDTGKVRRSHDSFFPVCLPTILKAVVCVAPWCAFDARSCSAKAR